MKNGKIVLIKNVRYTFGMNRNLMSVSELLEKGFPLNMKDNLLKLYDSDKKLIMQSAWRRNKTFKVNVETEDTRCLNAISVERESELWH